MPTIFPAFNTIILAASYEIGKIRSFGFLQFCPAYSRSLSATFWGINTTSCSFPLFGSLIINFRSWMSQNLSFKTSPILISPRAINSRINRLRTLVVLKIISFTVSFSIIFQLTVTFGRNNLRSIGKSQGFWNFNSRLFFRKLKKDDRWENRTGLVRGLQPSVMVFKNCRIFSEDSSVSSSPPKSLQSLLITHLYARTVFFFRVGNVVINPDFCSLWNFHGVPPFGFWVWQS